MTRHSNNREVTTHREFFVLVGLVVHDPEINVSKLMKINFIKDVWCSADQVSPHAV